MTLNELADWLARMEWRSTFTQRTLQRGHDYAARGRVLEFAMVPDGPLEGRLTGRIKGSGGRVYRCNVDVGHNSHWLLLV